MTGLIRCARCGLLGCQECVRSYRERIVELESRSVLAEADAKKCRRVLEKWAEYRFCCSDTPSKEKLDKMLADVEDATMELLGYKALVP